MTNSFSVDSSSADSQRSSCKIQRCFNCFDFLVVKPTEEFAVVCPYCGCSQIPYFRRLQENKNDPRMQELSSRLSSNPELQKRDSLLRSLRVWQFRVRNKLGPYEEMPSFFEVLEGGKLEFREVADDG